MRNTALEFGLPAHTGMRHEDFYSATFGEDAFPLRAYTGMRQASHRATPCYGNG